MRTRRSIEVALRATLLAAVATSLLGACKKSVLGPEITSPERPAAADAGSTDGVVSGVDQPTDGGSPASPSPSPAPASPSPSAPSASTACTRTSGHNVYYFASSITLVYTCDVAVTSYDSTLTPSFLTPVISGNTVTFTGTAPAAAGLTIWSFGVNGITTTGDAASVSTNIITTATLASTMTDPINSSGNNDVELDLVHRVTLGSTWDGSMNSVTLTSTSMATDLHGLGFASSCTGAVAPYLCNGTTTYPSALTADGALKLRWKYSPFDQGTYYLDVNPRVTIESGVNDLALNSSDITIPIQAVLTTLDTDSPRDTNTGYNGVMYNYSLAAGGTSTATNPVMGLVYVGEDGNDANFFTRISINRASTSASITQPTASDELSPANSSDAILRGLSNGSWVALGITTTTGTTDLEFFPVSNSTTDPVVGASTILTDYTTTTHSAVALDATKPFTDSDASERMGVALVRRESNVSYLTIAKVRTQPSSTTWSDVTDDTRYRADKHDGTRAGDFVIVGGGANVDIDRVKIRRRVESGTGYFYVAYRLETDVVVTKLLSTYAAGYGASSATLAAGVLGDLAMSDSEQSLDMALGVQSGATVVGVVYRKAATGRCFFKRFDQTLGTASAELQLSANVCYFPTIHYHSVSGRFVVTFADQDADRNANNQYDIVKREITLVGNGQSGSPDTLSSLVEVVQTGSTNRPIKVATELYEDGDWVAIAYRRVSTTPVRFHGYHVSDR